MSRKNVTIIHEAEEYDVLRAVADVLQERGIASPCTDEPRCQSFYGEPWHLSDGRTWGEVEAVDAEISRRVKP